MGIVFSTFLVIIGLLIYYYNPKYLFIYWLCWEPIIVPILCLVLGIRNRESTFEIVEISRNTGRFLFLIVFILGFIRNKIINLQLLFPIVLLIIFYFFQSLVLDSSLHSVWAHTSELLSLMIGFFLIDSNSNVIPDKNTLIKTIVLILLIQLVWVVLNLMGIYIYLTFYYKYYIESMGFVVEGFENSLVSGTFPRYNALANFLTTIYLFFSLEYFYNDIVSRKQYYYLSFVAFVVVFLTGARVSVILFIFIYGICCFLVRKKHAFEFNSFIVVGFIASIFLIGLLSMIETSFQSDGILRNVQGIKDILESNDNIEGSTIGLSTYLLDNYFVDNAIFIGNSYSYKGELAYGNLGMVTLRNFVADSRIAFILVEYGVIGFILYIFLYSKVYNLLINRVGNIKNKIMIFIIFIYFFLLTITEAGFFDRMFFPLIYIYVFTFMKCDKVKLK